MNTNNKSGDNPLGPLLLEAGIILVLLQQLEHVVKTCREFLKINDIEITSKDILSEEPKQSFQTLGKILKSMKKPMSFKPSFNDRLDNFVKSRNTFTHDYWTKNEIYSTDELIDRAAFQRITAFEAHLHSETVYMTQVFIGLSYSIGAILAAGEGKIEEFESDPNYDNMKKYVPLFQSVVENVQTE